MNDNDCFVWSILAKFHYDETSHRQRVSHYEYKKCREEINTYDTEMPFKVNDLDKFHIPIYQYQYLS